MNLTTRLSILIVTDNQLAKEKSHTLNLTIYELKQDFKVEIIRAENDQAEIQILDKILKEPFHLILVPLLWYPKWKKIENFLGIERTKGPTIAGYFCEPVPFQKLPSIPRQVRRIIIDLCNTTLQEQLLFIRTLAFDQHRSGILPLLPTPTPVYVENWSNQHGLTRRFDHILGLPEIAKTEWNNRTSAVKNLLSSLWNLIYGESPQHDGPPMNAYFQIGIDSSCLALRVCYSSRPQLSPENCVSLFSPKPEASTHPAQQLLSCSDFLRIHTLGKTPVIEVVVGLLPSAPAKKTTNQLHTLWIEPISEEIAIELPNATPSAQNPHLRTIPAAAEIAPNLRPFGTRVAPTKTEPKAPTETSGAEWEPAKTKKIETKIIYLQEKLKERDNKIKELIQGGVGTSAALGPPDAEALLEGFQERYFDAKHQIRQFEIDIMKLEKNGGVSADIETLRLKMDALRNREAAWLKKLMATIELIKTSKS